MLRHVHTPGMVRFDPKATPPYLLESRHVEEAYKSLDLRKQIRDRFHWTLQLDPRYQVIAYAIAHGMHEDEQRQIEGFRVKWVRDQALYFWERGFRSDPSAESFRVLLDEMVDLGILRAVRDDRYALRSPNVVLLMGTFDEIETTLVEFDKREPLPEYEPTAFRAADREVPWRRSPLTAQQESELRARRNDVVLLTGSRAAGLDALEATLRSLLGTDFFVKLERGTTAGFFSTELKTALERRKQEGVTLVFVPHTASWTLKWTEEALQMVGRLTSKTSYVHVVFVADPEKAWALGDVEEPLEALAAGGLAQMKLKPWHEAALRRWLDDCGFGLVDPPSRVRIEEVTGNWPLFLEAFYETTRSALHRWKEGLQKLEEKMGEADGTFAQELGVVAPDVCRVLGNLGTLGEASVEDLGAVTDGVPAEGVRKVVWWADLFDLVRPAGHNTWRIDPVVNRVLRSGAVAAVE